MKINKFLYQNKYKRPILINKDNTGNNKIFINLNFNII